MAQSMKLVDNVTDDDIILDNLGQPVPAAVAILQDNMMKALNKAYPKWEGSWLIRIDTRGGIVQVYNTWFSGEMGFVLHITKIDPEMRRVRQLAGELFERYNIARNRGMTIRRAMADVKRDGIGRAQYED